MLVWIDLPGLILWVYNVRTVAFSQSRMNGREGTNTERIKSRCPGNWMLILDWYNGKLGISCCGKQKVECGVGKYVKKQPV